MVGVVLRLAVSPSGPGGTVLDPSIEWLCIPGWPSAQGDLSPSSSAPARLLENPGITQDQPSAEQAQGLASQARRFMSKVRGISSFAHGKHNSPGESRVSACLSEKLSTGLPCSSPGGGKWAIPKT